MDIQSVPFGEKVMKRPSKMVSCTITIRLEGIRCKRRKT